MRWKTGFVDFRLFARVSSMPLSEDAQDFVSSVMDSLDAARFTYSLDVVENKLSERRYNDFFNVHALLVVWWCLVVVGVKMSLVFFTLPLAISRILSSSFLR